MTREQAADFKRRWRAVNDAAIEEARALTAEERLRDLASLMGFARGLQTPESLARDAREEEAVRARWGRLRERCHE